MTMLEVSRQQALGEALATAAVVIMLPAACASVGYLLSGTS